MPERLKISLADLVAFAVVVATLSVYGLERGASTEAKDRSTAITGLAGSLRNGAALAHSIWLSAGPQAQMIDWHNGEKIEIDLMTGYPRASETGISATLPELPWVAERMEAGAYRFSLNGRSAADCHVLYTLGNTPGQPPRVTVKNDTNGGDCGG